MEVWLCVLSSICLPKRSTFHQARKANWTTLDNGTFENQLLSGSLFRARIVFIFLFLNTFNLLRLCIWLKNSLNVQPGIYNEKYAFLPPQPQPSAPRSSLLPLSSVEYFMQSILLVIRLLELTLAKFSQPFEKEKKKVLKF